MVGKSAGGRITTGVCLYRGSGCIITFQYTRCLTSTMRTCSLLSSPHIFNIFQNDPLPNLRYPARAHRGGR
jgi:hypothetical protein